MTRYDLCLLSLLHSREGRKGGGGSDRILVHESAAGMIALFVKMRTRLWASIVNVAGGRCASAPPLTPEGGMIPVQGVDVSHCASAPPLTPEGGDDPSAGGGCLTLRICAPSPPLSPPLTPVLTVSLECAQCRPQYRLAAHHGPEEEEEAWGGQRRQSNVGLGCGTRGDGRALWFVRQAGEEEV